MREILFRGKRVDNGEWVYGNLIASDDAIDGYETIIIPKKNSNMYTDKSEENCTFEKWYVVDPETVCQYTGLKDENGKKMFEGDILKLTDEPNGAECTAVVKFGNPNGEYNWGFQLVKIDGDNLNIDILLWVEMEETGAYAEIIGNIFDSSQLLGGTE